MISIEEMLAVLKKTEANRAKFPAKAFARPNFIDSLPIDAGKSVPALGGLPIHRTDALPKGVLCLFLNERGEPVGSVVDETYVSQKAKAAHPDAGGSVEAMQELTEARSKLRGGL